MKKNEMIDAICRRYLSLNEKDYSEGRIDRKVKVMCDLSVKEFATMLEGFTEGEVGTFFSLDRGVQISVFSWHSGCANTFGMPKPLVEKMARSLEKAMDASGYLVIPVVKKIMDLSRKNMDWMLRGEYEDLGNGCGVYTFNN